MCSSSFDDNKGEDLNVIDVYPIKYLFCNMNLDNDGTGDESTLVKRHPNDSEFLDLDDKLGKSGIGEVVGVKTGRSWVGGPDLCV